MHPEDEDDIIDPIAEDERYFGKAPMWADVDPPELHQATARRRAEFSPVTAKAAKSEHQSPGLNASAR